MPETCEQLPQFMTSTRIEPKREYAPTSTTSKQTMELDQMYNCRNYEPVPVVVSKGQGCWVWNPEGEKFIDFAAAQGALNFGHCHPRIVAEVMDQVQNLTIASRAFHNDTQAEFLRTVCNTFGYERALPQNTGAEAAETAVKLARKWGYRMKGIPSDRAVIVVQIGQFMGRTLGAVSASTDVVMNVDSGPLLPGFVHVPFGDAEAVENALKDPYVCAFYCEPILGEAGVYVPPKGFYKQAQEICKRHNCLFIADEVQTGLGRTGYDLGVYRDGARPDVVALGKSISGGILPVSVVLADACVMDAMRNNEHGSTFGGCALGSRAGIASLKLLKELNLSQHAAEMGEKMRKRLHAMKDKYSFIIEVRGVGLLNAIELDHSFHTSAADICAMMMKNGVLMKQTHVYSIRLCPPCIITDEEMDFALDIVEQALDEVSKKN
eukprot:GHVO01004178.1.p1 GENE.GHVO01004178.1~~GHVO01004178.1.p1  ORF type:complete len:436 (+),score=62.31 GHVO01004178.1:30-1337(+)